MGNWAKLDRDFWRKLMLLLTSTLVIMADLTVSPILPQIQSHFSDVENINLLVKLVLTTPALFIVVSSPFLGYLLDKYGRKNIILVCILVYILAGTSGFWAGSIYELLIGRAFLGIATGGIINGCSALVGDYYKGEEVSRMMGLQSAFIGYAGIICIFLGGLLGDINWRATFLVYLLPLVFLAMFNKFIDEPEYISVNSKSSPLNFLGTTKNGFLKKLITIYIIAFVLMIFFYMMPLQLPFYLKSITNISNTFLGLAIAIMPLCSASTAMFYKGLKKIFSYGSIFALSFFSMGVGFLIIVAVPKLIFSLLGLIFAGLAMGMIIPNLRSWIGACTESAFLGRAFGGLTTSLYLGQFFSPIIVNPVISIADIPTSFSTAGTIMILTSAVFIFSKLR